MNLFRLLLVAIVATVGVYTVGVVSQHGMDFVTPFLADISKMGWPGQFNMDFASLPDSRLAMADVATSFFDPRCLLRSCHLRGRRAVFMQLFAGRYSKG